MAKDLEKYADELELAGQKAAAKALRSEAQSLRSNKGPEYFADLPNRSTAEGYVPLEKASSDLKREPYNPDVVTQFSRSLLTSDVPDCDYSQKELKELARLSLAPIYLAGISLEKLGTMFPQLGSWAVQEGNGIVEVEKLRGWVNMDASLNAPDRYKDTTESKLLEKYRQEGRQPGGVEDYIMLGIYTKAVFDYYPDQGNTWVRLPRSRREGRAVGAYFFSLGSLDVGSDLVPGFSDPSLRGRSVGVK